MWYVGAANMADPSDDFRSSSSRCRYVSKEKKCETHFLFFSDSNRNPFSSESSFSNVSVGAARAAQAVFGCFSFDSGSICEGEENSWPDGARQAETAAPVRVFVVVLDRRRGRCEGTNKQAVTTIYQQKSMGHDRGSSSGNHENKTKFVLDCNLIGRKKKGKNGCNLELDVSNKDNLKAWKLIAG
ncbi:unnamed protein product [Lactuca virosa]|uniref:Uncharacterized protein n=1 Tax=Lactuca virosa TaxID=75947 RepID=A0AAU9PV88_9ASTR|nr:unnamed protein product [Lactuca virosa]